ncbi:MAG TPA: ABC transporter permease [Bacteroidales bacterium]|jgi:putative ABC transport system permease protein|nr:ABC transporter permease [Bacteroidales bacterium]HPH52468.1 ABC transporter permease [Bacteroidales bacterium]HQP78976.1 ABC transporter permease [Bacteroidales bacterium]
MRDLLADKLRTTLSLAGVSIGIFSIVAVFTVVDSLKESVNEGFRKFGSDVVIVERVPLEPDFDRDGRQKLWQYESRPQIGWPEYLFLQENSAAAGNMAFSASFEMECAAGRESYDEGAFVAVDGDWRMLVQEKILHGRGFTSGELASGAAVTIIGSEVAQKLFADIADPVGRMITVRGVPLRVIGIFDSAGDNLVGMMDVDCVRLIPVRFAFRIADITSPAVKTRIIASPHQAGERSSDGISKEEFKSELRMLMRQYRRLRPVQEDDFALNELSFVAEQFRSVFGMVNTVGWVVGIFSLLVGGFGIVNIMYVSVEERTRIIGIKKALGARKRVITMQFLAEAATLSTLGGLAGIVLVWFATLLIPDTLFPIYLSPSNVLKGIAIALVIGVVSGVAPARYAASLHPVEAINS